MMNMLKRTAAILLLAMGVSQARINAQGDAQERTAYEQAARYANFRVSDLDAGNAEPQTKVNP